MIETLVGPDVTTRIPSSTTYRLCGPYRVVLGTQTYPYGTAGFRTPFLTLPSAVERWDPDEGWVEHPVVGFIADSRRVARELWIVAQEGIMRTSQFDDALYAGARAIGATTGMVLSPSVQKVTRLFPD